MENMKKTSTRIEAFLRVPNQCVCGYEVSVGVSDWYAGGSWMGAWGRPQSSGVLVL